MDRRSFVARLTAGLTVATASFKAPARNAGPCASRSPACRNQVKRPNILWIMSDEQRTDSLGCYGSSWARAPHLDRLAREGVRFTNAVTPAPVSGPARASLITGCYPHELGIGWNLKGNLPTLDHLTEHFHRAGYRSASFGKRHYCAKNNAFQTEDVFEVSDAVSWYAYADEFKADEYDAVQYPDEPYPWIFGGRFPLSAEHKSEARAVREAMPWLEESRDAPFFLRISFNAPHTPVVPPEPYDTLIDAGDITFPPQTETVPAGEPRWISQDLRPIANAARLTPDQVQKARKYYYGEVAFLDSQVGALLDWMKDRDLLDNTIVVFVADHGTHLGDYGLVQKQTFYEPVVTVPYIFWYPAAIPAGLGLNTPVETRSLIPTLMELAGIPVPRKMRKASLAKAICAGHEPTPGPVFSEFTLGTFNVRRDDWLVMVREGRWKLSLCFPGGDTASGSDGALYDLEADPHECDNLYGQTACAKIQKSLANAIARHLRGFRARPFSAENATMRHTGPAALED